MSRVDIAIGGVTFAAESADLELAPRADYAGFGGDGSATGETVHVHVQRGPGAEAGVAPLLFRSDQAWSLTRCVGAYRMWSGGGGPLGPHWDARWAPGMHEVVLYAGVAGAGPVPNPIAYPLDQLLLMYYLATRRGLILHGAGAVLGGRSFVFAGRSGAGKTTLARQFQSEARLQLLSDDRIVVRGRPGRYEAFGTPWPGEARVARSARAPLGGIFFITHGLENRVRPLPASFIADRLLPVCSILWFDRWVLPEMLDFCDELIRSVPFYEFECRPMQDAAAFFLDFAGARL
jgi:hypothetical protein